MTVLHLAARSGRICLVAGLLAGAALPGVATVLKPWLPELVALLLFLTAVRVGPKTAFGSMKDLKRVCGFIFVLQLAAPVIAIALFSFANVLTHPFALAVVLMLAAPSVTGAPNFLIMLTQDPSHALRILVLGTAVFPITVVPVLWLLPVAEGGAAFEAAIRLIAVILAATGAGFLFRHLGLKELSDDARLNVDGISAIALAVIVVGLMTEIGPMLVNEPKRLLYWALAVLTLNFGLQIATFILLRKTGWPETPALSIISGNRNIALFLIALPPDVTGPLLVFIGCYQIPMYLTPLVLGPVYNRLTSPKT